MNPEEANALLLARRAALGVVPKYTATAVDPATPTRPNFERDNAIRLIEQIRQRDGLTTPPKPQPTLPPLPAAPTEPAKPTAVAPSPVAPLGVAMATAVTLKNHSLLGIAILNQKKTAVYRVWLLCRYLDKDGRGWLSLKELRAALTAKESPHYLFNYRRWRQIVGEGSGTFWQEANGRLWLFGVSRLAIALGVAKVGKPVALPLATITGDLKQFNAHLYASWDTRRKPSPISRQKRAAVLGVPERTQRHYCRTAGIKRVANYALVTPNDVQSYAWHHGGTAIFPFTDFKGRNGRKGKRYTARQLPTTQKARHERANVGRTQKINQRINLVIQASRAKTERLFFESAKQATKKASRGRECFWRYHQSADYGLWVHFFYS